MHGIKNGKSTVSTKLVPINKLKGHEFGDEAPYGAAKKIAEITGFAPSYVSRVIKGQNFNEEIIKELLELIKNTEKVEIPERIAKKVS